jgi:hypothetical protein
MAKKNQPKETSRKKYTIELIEYDDGSRRLTRTNDGFEAFSLMGRLTHVITEIGMSISLKDNPSFQIIRTVTKPDGTVIKSEIIPIKKDNSKN